MKLKKYVLAFVMLFAVFGILGYKTPVVASSMGKVICVTQIKGKYVYYYDCDVNIETPEIKGTRKRAKLTNKTKYYCYLTDDFDAMTEVPQVSKKTFKKAMKDAKQWGNIGFYVFGKFKGGRCVRLMEPYWP